MDLHSLPAILPLPLVTSHYLFLSRAPHVALLSLYLSRFISQPPSVALQKHTPASLKRNSSRVAGISDTFRHNRKCRGNVITYRKRHVSIRMQRRGIGRWKQKGNYERDRDRERQIDREREKEKEKGVKRRKGGRKYCKEKRSRRNPFLREKDTYA